MARKVSRLRSIIGGSPGTESSLINKRGSYLKSEKRAPLSRCFYDFLDLVF